MIYLLALMTHLIPQDHQDRELHFLLKGLAGIAEEFSWKMIHLYRPGTCLLHQLGDLKQSLLTGMKLFRSPYLHHQGGVSYHQTTEDQTEQCHGHPWDREPMEESLLQLDDLEECLFKGMKLFRSAYLHHQGGDSYHKITEDQTGHCHGHPLNGDPTDLEGTSVLDLGPHMQEITIDDLQGGIPRGAGHPQGTIHAVTLLEGDPGHHPVTVTMELVDLETIYLLLDLAL